LGVPNQQKAAADHLWPAPIFLSCHCRTRERIRLSFWGYTAAEFAYLQSVTLAVTLAVRFMCFRSECAVTHLLRRAACILSRRYEFSVLRLGGVAAAGAGFVRVIGSQGAGNGQFCCPCGVVSFDGEVNLVVSDGGNHRIQVLRYIDGTHLRTIGSRGA